MDPQADKELKNVLAINSLMKDVVKIREQQGVMLVFSPYVIYQHNGIEDKEKMTVRIQLTGFNNGDIEMDEGTCILASTHHLGFSARKEDYTYDKFQKIFTITGKSRKMGDYKIKYLIDESI